MIVLLDIAAFSLIAFMIDKFNTSRFLSIHWNLWKYVFNFLLHPYSPLNFYNTYYYDTSAGSNYHHNMKRYRNNSHSTVRSRSSRNSSRSSRSSNPSNPSNNTGTTATTNEPSSNPPTMIIINALSPTDSANEAQMHHETVPPQPPPPPPPHEEALDISYGECRDIESIIELSKSSNKSQNSLPDIMLDETNKKNNNQITINQLDATELQVKLNTLANSGYKIKKRKRNKARSHNKSSGGGLNAYALRKKKQKEFEKQIQTKFEIPWTVEKDTLIRLCTVNYILAQNRECRKLYKFLERSLQSDFFNNVSYNELRYYSSGGVTFYDFIFTYHHDYIVEKWRALSKHAKSNSTSSIHFRYQKLELVLKWFGLFIVLPLYVLSQLLFALFPYVLFVYHNIDAVHFDSLKVLQYVLIALYTLFVGLLLCLFPLICKFTRITCYIHYNCMLYFTSYHFASQDYIEKKMMHDIKKLYQNLVATQLRANLLHKIFGNDVCELVLSYLPSFHIVMDENQLLLLNAEQENNDNAVTQLNDFEEDENWNKFMLYNNHRNIHHLNDDDDGNKSNDDDEEEEEEELEEEEEEEKYCMDVDGNEKRHHHQHTDNDEQEEEEEDIQMQICVTPAIHPQQQTLGEDGDGEEQLTAPPMINLHPLLISNLSDVSNLDQADAESNPSASDQENENEHAATGNTTDHSNHSLTPH